MKTQQNESSSLANSKRKPNDAAWFAQFNIELLRIATGDFDEEQTRTQLRLAAIQFANVDAICHIVRFENDNWQILNGKITGKKKLVLDQWDPIVTKLKTSAQFQTLQIEQLPESNHISVLVPIMMFGQQPEALLLLAESDREIEKVICAAEKVAELLKVCIKQENSQKSDWKLNSLASMIELISTIENCQTVNEGLLVVVNEMSRHLQVAVAVAESKHGSPKGIFVSGNAKLEKRGATYHAYHQCLSESLLRKDPGTWPSKNQENNQLLLSHRQLASQLNCESVFSHALNSTNGKAFGAWVFSGNADTIQSERFQNFVAAVSPRVANTLSLLRRAQKPMVQRAAGKLVNQFAKRKTQIGLAMALGIVTVMCMPFPYNVRCHCSIEPSMRRFAVAPFDGMVLKGYAKPGDNVAAGQVLAEMDGRQVRYELAGLVAKQKQATNQRAIELAERNISKMLLAELESNRVAAEQDLLEFKRNNLTIKSPIDGVVLGGTLERAESAGVSTGEVLYEIGSDLGQLVEIEIPADEISQVKTGMQVSIWIRGQESEPIEGKIHSIRPQSEMRNSANIFVAEIEIADKTANLKLRPGMKGSARISCEKHPLAWNLFHKPIDFLRSRLVW